MYICSIVPLESVSDSWTVKHHVNFQHPSLEMWMNIPIQQDMCIDFKHLVLTCFHSAIGWSELQHNNPTVLTLAINYNVKISERIL